jgi:hypothetical protein
VDSAASMRLQKWMLWFHRNRRNGFRGLNETTESFMILRKPSWKRRSGCCGFIETAEADSAPRSQWDYGILYDTAEAFVKTIIGSQFL